MSSLLMLIAQLSQAVPGLAPRGDLFRRIDSVDRAIGRLSAELNAEVPREQTDTVEVGPFQVALDRRDVERFVPVATAISHEWEAMFGPAAPRLFLQVVISPWSGARTVSVRIDSTGMVVGAAVIQWTEIRRGQRERPVRRAFSP